MRKLSLFVCSSLVLLGMLGLQAQVASATFDPEGDCAGKPAGVQGFHFGTVTTKGGATSAVYAGAALCNTIVNHTWYLSDEVLGAYKEGYVLTPGGMDAGDGGPTIRCANPAHPHVSNCSGTELPSGAYAGNSGTDNEGCVTSGGANNLGDWCSFIQSYSKGYVNQSPGNDANDKCVQGNPNTVVQCFQSKDTGIISLGYTNITVQPCWLVSVCKPYDPQHVRYLIHIYPINSLLGGPAYYTEIGKPSYKHSGEPDPNDYYQCEFANTTGDGCGTNAANWIQKNPPAGTYDCKAGKYEGAAVRVVTIGDLGKQADRCYKVTYTP